VRQGIAVLAAFVVVALGLSAPSLAQDLASSAVAVTPVPAEAPVNFSLLGLFLSADWIVKIVIWGCLRPLSGAGRSSSTSRCCMVAPTGR
jgi:hypothetical protein